MTKNTIPVHLQGELMQAASIAGARMRLSAGEQVEYWALLGRQISHFIDSGALLEVAAGLASLKVEPAQIQAIDPEAVFCSIEADRDSGTLAGKVATADIRYQTSTSHPGYLERIDKDGVRISGTFQGGTFVPIEGISTPSSQ